jgi:ribosomal protein S18 acetylase RimI-like enzyme
MGPQKMEFEIGTADSLKIDDVELSELLTQVYVAGGFTEPDEATLLFEPSAVRKRGVLIGAREKQHLKLAGIIIVVPPDSAARLLAKNNEAELHLLGVKPEFRRHGLGRMLVESAITRAKHNDYSKIILWTQVSMELAQKLYTATRFVHVDDMKRNGRDFKVYEMALRT